MPERLQLTLDYTFKKTFTEKHEILIDLINSVLELPSTSKIEWLYFLKNAHKEKEENMQKKYANPMIHEAFHLLNDLSANDEARLQARARERAIFNA